MFFLVLIVGPSIGKLLLTNCRLGDLLSANQPLLHLGFVLDHMLLEQGKGREMLSTPLKVAGEAGLLQLLEICLLPLLNSLHLVQILLMLLHLSLPPVQPNASSLSLTSPLLLHCCVTSLAFTTLGKIHLEQYSIIWHLATKAPDDTLHMSNHQV